MHRPKIQNETSHKTTKNYNTEAERLCITVSPFFAALKNKKASELQIKNNVIRQQK